MVLRWEDIDGDKITIDKQTSRNYNNKVKLITLKNSASYRTIKIDQDLLRELKKFKLKQNELILANGRFRKNEDGIIFQNYNGHYLTPSTVRGTIKDYCKKAGVKYKGTHVFRHTLDVLLLESGASLKWYLID
ncbi:tyrosine-type recombinase/integrase [Neobacillus cucumis]|uniref:tyrosine-type recombinase/integrase n=1 Tax=Neobacillus cucumis TaxID=1740721 RepID=UPI00203E251A|nr:tyrosine-type recombinase/integrase [Neobacillus cucumis]MCM3725036.1 tyrosine-type recombinase/integrase [Neobacillus cucumis]